MSVALGPVIQNNADIWALPDQECGGLSLLARSFGLRPGRRRGGAGRDGLVEPLFSAAVWTFAAFNLTLDMVRQTNRLDTAIFSGGKGL